MKKKTFKILFLLTAALIITALPAIPHHHHGGEACLAHQLCHEDEEDNDRHTEHHDDGTQCVEHVMYLAPEKPGDENNLRDAADLFPPTHFAAILETGLRLTYISSFTYLLTPADCDSPRTGASLSTSLRAPPQAL